MQCCATALAPGEITASISPARPRPVTLVKTRKRQNCPSFFFFLHLQLKSTRAGVSAQIRSVRSRRHLPSSPRVRLSSLSLSDASNSYIEGHQEGTTPPVLIVIPRLRPKTKHRTSLTTYFCPATPMRRRSLLALPFRFAASRRNQFALGRARVSPVMLSTRIARVFFAASFWSSSSWIRGMR